MTYKQKLKEMGLFILKGEVMERRRNHTAVCNYVMGKSREDRARLSSEVHSNRTRANRGVLEHGKLQLF